MAEKNNRIHLAIFSVAFHAYLLYSGIFVKEIMGLFCRFMWSTPKHIRRSSIVGGYPFRVYRQSP
jgi:hypothetical protein